MYAYILPDTPYARHNGYVRIHTFVRILQVMLWYPYIPFIIVSICCALVYSAWYQVLPACESSTGWNFSLVTIGHITTNPHEHTTALGASREEWRCRYGASTDALGVEIGCAFAAFEGRTSMQTHTGK